MKLEDLKTKTEDELKKLLLDTRKAQLNLRFQKANGQMEKTHEVRANRRLVARIKTLLNQKQSQVTAKAKKAA